MTDVREAILQRLHAIAGEIDGVLTHDRNVAVIEDGAVKLPAVVVLDGDEEANPNDPRGRSPMIKRRVEMTPHLLVVVGATPAQVGPELNTLRERIMVAVLSDTVLQSLVLNRIGIRYDGMASPRDEMGRMVLSQRHVRFTFTYILDPQALSSTA